MYNAYTLLIGGYVPVPYKKSKSVRQRILIFLLYPKTTSSTLHSLFVYSQREGEWKWEGRQEAMLAHVGWGGEGVMGEAGSDG